MRTNNRSRKYCGFSLIELLIVIALLGFLSITGLSLFQGSQKRTRDSRRKTELQQLTKELEMYANDYSGYPSSTGGKIMGCAGTGTDPVACTWGSAWVRGSTYTQKLPKDPGSGSYCYERDAASGKWYKLYAKLEGTDDADYNSDVNLLCAGEKYTYVVLSPNITPTPKP